MFDEFHKMWRDRIKKGNFKVLIRDRGGIGWDGYSGYLTVIKKGLYWEVRYCGPNDYEDYSHKFRSVNEAVEPVVNFMERSVVINSGYTIREL